MYKYEELNDPKDRRPFPLPTNSTYKQRNQFKYAGGCLVNDRFPQGKDRQRKSSDKGLFLEALMNRGQTSVFGSNARKWNFRQQKGRFREVSRKNVDIARE